MLQFEDHGRFHYLRILPPVSGEEVTEYRAGRRARALNGKAVVCVDLRFGSVISPEASEGFLRAMKGNGIERLALVVPDKVLLAMQAGRMAREAGDPNRTFSDAAQAEQWLCEVLAPHEQVELRALMGGRRPVQEISRR